MEKSLNVQGRPSWLGRLQKEAFTKLLWSPLELWFSDNIAADVARYLYLTAKTESTIIEAHR